MVDKWSDYELVWVYIVSYKESNSDESHIYSDE